MIADTDPAVLARAAELLIAQHGFTDDKAAILHTVATREAKSVADVARMAEMLRRLSNATMLHVQRDLARLARAEARGWRLRVRPDTAIWQIAASANVEYILYRSRIERKQQRRFAQRIARTLGQEVQS